jgi:hypothetical protein
MPSDKDLITCREERKEFWRFVEKYYQDEDDILLYGVLVCEFDTELIHKISKCAFPPVNSGTYH